MLRNQPRDLPSPTQAGEVVVSEKCFGLPLGGFESPRQKELPSQPCGQEAFTHTATVVIMTSLLCKPAWGSVSAKKMYVILQHLSVPNAA